MSGFLPGSITHVLVRPSCLSGNEEFGIGKSKHIMLAICLCNYKVDGTRRPCSSACAREIIRLLINSVFLPSCAHKIQARVGSAPDFLTVLKSSRKTLPRSEERRVGKECRSRWSPY